MSNSLRITVAQLNPIVGDVEGNLALAFEVLEKARADQSDLVVFSELFLLSYPPEDLVLKPAVTKACFDALTRLANSMTVSDPAVLIGAPWRSDTGVRNSAFLLRGGKIDLRFDKFELPNYGVFDDKRVFESGDGERLCFDLSGHRIGVAICEDIWLDTIPNKIRKDGADFLLALNASPWRRTIHRERKAAFARWEGEDLPYIFVNQMGGQDELVFDGASYCWTAKARHQWLFPDFESGVQTVEYAFDRSEFSIKEARPPLGGHEADYRAAVMALGDYVRKNRFPGVLIGLSGGIDSALAAAISVDALGAENVWCVMLPSKYTSDHSLEDAKACAEALGVRYDIISIKPGVDALGDMMAPAFAGTKEGVAEENIQSRLRAVALLALSNKFGHMVVTTGNKSEMAVGYATIYGDMSGGYNPLKDFYKTEVFEIAKWRNQSNAYHLLGAKGEVIPERIITKPPSAELREDQKDEDSLPPYEVLDDILRDLVDYEMSVSKICARGHDRDIVNRIEHLLYISEYKRYQAPPGPKIGPRNFGRDRRYPITSRWRDRNS
jgi:NAD+ synthase